MKRQWKFDDYTIKIQKEYTSSNYNIAVHIYKGKELIRGYYENERASEKDILNEAIISITNHEKGWEQDDFPATL